MDRTVTVSVVVAVVGILAVAVAASTLTSVVAPGSAGGGGGGNDTSSGLLPAPDPPEFGDGTFTLPPIVGQAMLALFLLGAAAGAVYAIYNWREALSSALLVVAMVAVIFLLIFLIQQLLGGGGGGAGIGFGGDAPGGLFSGDASGADTSLPPALLLVVGFALVAAVVTLFGATGDADVSPSPEEEPMLSPDVTGVGRAAGRAADRIESDDAGTGADVDNEVYRAWKEMTGHLEVERPQSSTPGEFAAAATAAGMDEDDVAELTRLFEEVRYGGRDPADREGRAVETLRRVEETYADAESEAATTDG